MNEIDLIRTFRATASGPSDDVIDAAHDRLHRAIDKRRERRRSPRALKLHLAVALVVVLALAAPALALQQWVSSLGHHHPLRRECWISAALTVGANAAASSTLARIRADPAVARAAVLHHATDGKAGIKIGLKPNARPAATAERLAKLADIDFAFYGCGTTSSGFVSHR